MKYKSYILLLPVTTFTKIIHTTYDVGDAAFQQNLRDRVAKTWNDHITTRYSYDVHGMATVIEHTTAELGTKRIEYDYDLLAGEIREVSYQVGEADQFYHRYGCGLQVYETCPMT